MKQRTITAIFFAAAMLGGIYGGKLPFFILFSIIAIGSLWEFLGLVLPNGEDKFLVRRILGVLIGFLPVWFFKNQLLWRSACAHSTDGEVVGIKTLYAVQGYSDVAIALIFAVWLFILFELFTKPQKPFSNIGAVLTGVFYIGIPISMLFSVSVHGWDFHPNRIFGLLWLTWTNDTAAYLIGSKIGKNKLFPRISPNKTWEGTIAGAVCTVLMAWGLSVIFPGDFEVEVWLAMGLVVALFGTLGDLVESMLKRSLGVKDSGNLLPGHGGLLDRFDAFLFVLPFAWLVFMILR